MMNLLLVLHARALVLLQAFEWLAPLVLRLYLAPVFWVAGWTKLQSFDATVAWFGDAEGGLNLPLPGLMAALATAAELGGAVALLLGLGVRLFCVPLLVTMLVAALKVHAVNGWSAIADASSLFADARTDEALVRLEKARELLREHGNYDWLTEYGSVVILNNGVEFAVTYAVMLLALLMLGAGRYCSLDWLIGQRVAASITRAPA